MYYRAMLTTHRKQLLIEQLRKNGQIIAKDMSEKFGLSEDTIRRDLRELAAEGKLLRVHGGALLLSPTVKNLKERSAISTEEKTVLGRAGAKMVQAGQTIFVDGGTTNLELIKALAADLQTTIVTHSPTIAAALEPHAKVRVYMVGGLLFRHSMVAVGAAALESMGNMRFDLCFIGCNGLHSEEGLTTGDYEEAAMKRAFINRSAQIVSLVTADKLGAVADHKVCAVDALSQIVIPRASTFKLAPGITKRVLRV